MADKKTKREINEVILKYLGKINDRAALKSMGIIGGVACGLGIGLDIICTGGLFSVGTFILGGMGTSVGAIAGGGLWSMSKKKNRTNAAAQTVESAELIYQALEKMESKLRKSFNKAALFYASAGDKKDFRSLAAEINQDIKKLSPAFKIVSGGPHGFGTDKYEFIMAEIPAPGGRKKLLTLAEALRTLDQPSAEKKKPLSKEPAPEKDDHELKTRIIKDLGKPNNPPSP
jgi:hypothetical protein